MLLLLFKALEFLNVVRFLSFKIPIFIARVPSVDFIKHFFSLFLQKKIFIIVAVVVVVAVLAVIISLSS